MTPTTKQTADLGVALKFDSGKPPMHFLPAVALSGAANVFGYGAVKYASYNWMKGLAWTRLYDAALRHMTAFMYGEDTDQESGLPHLDHALCCLMMLRANYEFRKDLDDRPPRMEQPNVSSP